MIKEAQQQIGFIDDFSRIAKERIENAPGWLKKLREESLCRLADIGVPSVQDEEWRYTNITPILDGSYQVETTGKLVETEPFKNYCSPDEISLTFVNGTFSKELSQLDGIPKGVIISTLHEALENNTDDIENVVNKFTADTACSFVSLNNAFSNNGVFIKVEKNVKIDKLIHIVHVTSSSNGQVLSLPRTFITCESSSEATIIESHVSFNDDISYFSNALTDIYLDENSMLHYCKAQKESLKAYHIGNTRVWQEKNSNLNGFSYMSGAAITRNNLEIILNGEGINSTLNGLYSNFANMHVDNHTYVDHRFPNCTSNQLYKGILNESSRAVFNGKIFVKPIAQLTNSYQLNKNLLLGENCRVDTKPQLEIFADDVKCTHGATIGQLNEDELFYLQTRSIPRKEAIRILSKGFVDDLINTINDDEIKRKLHILLKPSFARF